MREIHCRVPCVAPRKDIVSSTTPIGVRRKHGLRERDPVRLVVVLKRAIYGKTTLCQHLSLGDECFNNQLICRARMLVVDPASYRMEQEHQLSYNVHRYNIARAPSRKNYLYRKKP